MAERVAAGGVGRDHAADGAGRGAGRVRREPAADLRELRVQRRAHVTPGSDGDVSESIAQNAAKCTLRSRTSAGPSDFAGEPGARSARDQRQVVLVAVADEHRDVLGVFRNGDRERSDLKRAGVGRVQPAREARRSGAARGTGREGRR